MTSPSAALRRWFSTRQRELPWRAMDARGLRDPYRTWISEIMLQQTRVEAVVPYYLTFLEQFPDVFALAAASEEEVLQRWAGLGYYRRARYLHAAAKVVAEEWEGAFPPTASALQAMPGVGVYTSSAIASLAFGEAVPVVDGNVKRVMARWAGLELAADDAALEKASRALGAAWMVDLPEGNLQAPGELNEGLMELGATVCLPRNADCGACPLASGCAALAAGTVDSLPLPKKSKKWVDLEMVFLVHRVGVRVGLEKRASGWSPGLYEPPSAICEATPANPAATNSTIHETTATTLAAEQQAALGSYRGVVRHTITHHKIRAHVYTADLPAKTMLENPAEVPLTGLARKVLNLVPPD
ncbi:MAG: A/G-specific adenine glycosylase [Planctomycetota bacterium]